MSFLAESSTDGGGTSRSNGTNISAHRSNGNRGSTSATGRVVNSSNGSTTLAKMIAAAASQKRGVKWSHVLHYLKAHCVVRELNDDDDDDSSADYRQRHEEILRLESPLQAHYVANADLALELAPTSDGHSVLRAAVPVAPLSILRVLVHLGPSAVRHVDVVAGRMLLQTACRFPPTPVLDAALALLIVAYPPALVHRCHQGKTPLHYFLCHHANIRTPETTLLFCRNLQAYKEHFYTLRQPTSKTESNHQARQTAVAIPSSHGDPSSTNSRIRLPDIPKPGCSVPSSSSSTGQGAATKIPYNAAIIPDAVYGCLPLHYAALYGASPATVKVVYHAYPTAKHAVDSHGRTPLHWHLGAGTLDPEHPVTMEGDSLAIEVQTTDRLDSSEGMVTSSLHTPEDPAAPYYNRHLDPSIVQLLLSSRVVRTTDFQNRNPLHWLVTYIASHSYLSSSIANCATNNEESAWPLLSIVQLLLDSYASQCLAQDQWGMTPLTLLFHTVHKIQKRLYLAKCQPLGRKLCHGFGPPLALIQKLLMVPIQHHGTTSLGAPTSVTTAAAMTPPGMANQPNTIATKEDKAGRLPIHVALQIAASTEIVQFLIQLYPASLVHTTSTHETAPLHAAFDCEWTAPLQSVDTIASLLFQSYQAGKYGSTVDGRLAMKLEDAAGNYPIHYACHHGAAVAVIELLVDRYPACALLQKPNGDLPIHCIVQSNDSGNRLLSAALASAVPAVLVEGLHQHEEEKYDESGNVELLAETRAKLQCLIRPLLSDPGKLLVADSVTGMLPLHISVLFEAASYAVLLRMLELAPISAAQFTGNLESHNVFDSPSVHSKRVGRGYSALDLHDVCKSRTSICIDDEWQLTRELLFSFSPSLESHRHRQELLDRCVRIVIDEINGNSLGDEGANAPFHLAACREKEGNPPELELTHTVSAMEAEVRPRTGRTRRRRGISKRLAPNKSRHSREVATRRFFSPSSPERAKSPETLKRRQKASSSVKLQVTSSIYDDDDVHLQYDAPPMMSSENDDDFDDDGRSASTDGSGDGDETGTEGYGTHGDETGSRGSQSFLTGTASGSRQQTTFEDGSGEDSGSDEDSQTYNDESTIRSTYRQESERLSRRGRRNRRSADDESKDLSRRVTFEDESTVDHNSFDDDSISHSAGSIFDSAKQKLAGEEKKDDGEVINDNFLKPLKTPRATNRTQKEATNVRPSFMSEVGMRLWTFFIMYCDPRNPSDHYVNQLADIIGEISVVDFDMLISSPVPSYVTNYIEKGEINIGKSFRDVASPKCRELIHRTSYFLGKYDFSTEDDALVYRSQKNESVVVAAEEWQFVTEVATNAKMLGMSEENIWATGEALAEVGLTFQRHKKPVWIKFTKDASEYNNEIGVRLKLGVPVDDDDDSHSATTTDGFVSILQHFNASSSERQLDRTYSVHSKDSRFNAISLRSTSTCGKKVQILLHDYPFAIVYPAPSRGTLLDLLLRYGVDSVDDARQILTQVALALNSMHKSYICCGNLSLRNIVSKTSIDTPDIAPCWQLLHLSNAAHVGEHSSYLGGIDIQGRAQFDMDNFPPEMFANLSSDALKRYLKYWRYVESHFKISIDKALITPFVDLTTGATYVMKCHFIPLTTRPEDVSLPYDLVECNSGIDIWALGQLLFSLVTGRTMFHTSIRDGRFLNFGEIFHWEADLFLYDHVRDFLALDVLRQMLSDEASRKNLSIEFILLHPFFLNESDRGSSAHKLSEEVRFQVAMQNRALDAKLVASTEKTWLARRSVTIHCWDFNILRRFYLSPTEIVRGMTSRKMNIVIPCGIIMLPYNNPISYNAAFNGTSVHAERLGNAFLQLSKACFYANSMQEAIFKDNGVSACRWSLSKIMLLINLPSDDFHNVQTDMAYLSARHVESFRNDPMIVARKLVQERIEKVVYFFEDRDLFMYFVDEWSCRVVRCDSSPIPVTDQWRDPMIESGMLFTCICLLYVRGVSRGLDAFAALIFQTDDTAIPQSWVDSARGLTHELDDTAFQSEAMILQNGLRDVFGSQNGVNEALTVVQSFLSECDPMHNVGGMTRVVASEACIWTTTESADQLSHKAQLLTFKDALCKQKN